MGFSGRDLITEDGRWYTVEEATAFVAEIQPQILQKQGEARMAGRVLRPAPAPRLTNEGGFVYFLRSGERIKIGFSKNPFARGQQLMTGMSHGVHSFTFVPGTEREERRAHHALSRYRQSGEWFDCHPNVLKVVLRSLTFGRVMVEGEHEQETNVSHRATSASEMTHGVLSNRLIF